MYRFAAYGLAAMQCALLLAVSAFAQSGKPPGSTDARLRQLAADADDLEQRLPSFTCKESLVSQELRGGKVKHQVQASGEVRVRRVGDGALAEHFEVSEINGRPVKGTGQLSVPIFVSGGFKDALGYFLAEHQACFLTAFSGNRLDFKSAPGGKAGACAEVSGTQGVALLDGDGHVVHLERSVTEEQTTERHTIPFASLDLSRMEFDGKPFSLATHVVATIAKGKSTGHWEAEYSACHLFEVTVKVGPAAPADAAPPTSWPASGP